MANKGAALTGKITLPGRLLVYAPDQSGIVVSRRLGDEAERARLTEAVEAARAAEGITDGRFIVRTAAEGADAEELRQDAQRLASAWKSLSASQADATAPACLLSEGYPIERALRDFVTGDTERIRIDSAEGFLVARDYCRKQHPGLNAGSNISAARARSSKKGASRRTSRPRSSAWFSFPPAARSPLMRPRR